ncbi:hypothetical protein TGRUB_428730 [Toxoplasma gondii RUB]|uniref:Uncharacterized protein n=1 Tax=Toxoplasma gondii RUB TaxID=935652 RepID=A0A086MAN9_TOXGO|nr:hypothetical protein TGRUB_428730 [Toxoplasma gondii RUB]
MLSTHTRRRARTPFSSLWPLQSPPDPRDDDNLHNDSKKSFERIAILRKNRLQVNAKRLSTVLTRHRVRGAIPRRRRARRRVVKERSCGGNDEKGDAETVENCPQLCDERRLGTFFQTPLGGSGTARQPRRYVDVDCKERKRRAVLSSRRRGKWRRGGTRLLLGFRAVLR